MKSAFMQKFENVNYSRIVRASQIRSEDHVKMMDLQGEMTELRLKLETQKDPVQTWTMESIVVTILLSLVIVALGGYTARYKYVQLQKKSKMTISHLHASL
jgi:hypothetical protein